MTLEERVAEWPKPYIRQGREEGISLGIAHERQLLRRMAAARFGAATADRLARALAAEADPERLAIVGEAIVRAARRATNCCGRRASSHRSWHARGPRHRNGAAS